MPSSPRQRLVDLFAKVDAFFANTSTALPGPSGVTCHAGCDDCCRKRLSVTALEADVIAAGLDAMPPPARAALRSSARSRDGDACAALIEGRCAIYDVRPVVCRTHGLPIRFARAGGRALPIVDACPRNFRDVDLAALPAGLVLDQTTVSTVLGALDVAHADAAGRPRGERVDLAELVARDAS